MSDEDTYEIPLQDQRVFGAGIKRKRVKFVPSTEKGTSSTVASPAKTPATSVSDLYMQLVLPEDGNSSLEIPSSATHSSGSLLDCFKHSGGHTEGVQVCEICNLPLSPDNFDMLPTANDNDPSGVEQPLKLRPHEASLAHQVCLTHSHPPSHLDRNRKGLAYLLAYGWDPDSRRGLGVEGQGIQFPIKTKSKDDKLGIGVVLPKDGDRRKQEKIEKLDAGKVRKLHERDKKKAERLREMFYQNDDVERYLGGGER